MAYQIVFQSTERSNLNTQLVVDVNIYNEVFISISNVDDPYLEGLITLERESAIKLAKELRKQISFLEA